ncbi:hypothetical protein BB934_45100 (plasmid) [Microvirga ossetica]|uniref:Cadherin domain-containing protein n=1 Tax=Microvirga ossetica TaxID=1882682 RepID=A0A1B2EZH7_9HYPH|nr:tandem-95 repeat protein [Microvirga ossetica]ANY85399.1 hypothetical protein BB934_45100 [Microvirga ossetica]
MATLNGTPGNDTIPGTNSADTINGRGGRDLLNGLGGDDLIDGDEGDDTLNGGIGHDTLRGGIGIDVLDGGDGHDNLNGNAGADRLLGGLGNDTLAGGGDSDYLDGGDGNDRLEGGSVADTLLGGAGIDTLIAGAGDDRLEGGGGTDNMDGGTGNDFMDGGSENDTMTGGSGNDTMLGGAGDDRMVADVGDDSLDGGTGDDRMEGGDGNDRLSGGDGADTIDGGNGTDGIEGGIGNDSLSGAAGNDTLSGGDGNDRLDGGNDHDSIDGGTGADSITGGSGNDTVTGGTGNDTIDGGTGTDTVVLSGNVDDYTFTRVSTSVLQVAGTDGTDRLSGVEFLRIGSQTYDMNGPIARSDTGSGTENQIITVANVLADDVSLSGAALRVQRLGGGNANTGDTVATVDGIAVRLGLNNSLVVIPGTTYDNLSQGESVQRTFTYTVGNGSGNLSTANVTLTITGANDGPVAVSDARATNEDTPLAFAASTLVANDTDIDRLDVLTVTGVTATADTHGTVTLTNGQITYSPAADYNGPASFRYTVSDGRGGTATGTVNVTVTAVADNAAPVAANGSASGNEDSVISGTVSAADGDGDALTYALVQGPRDANGNAVTGLTFNPNGTYSFQGPANFNGSVTFTYKANDGSADSNVATVTLTANSVNDAPVAQAASSSGDEDTITTGSVAATDVDGSTLTYSVVQSARDANGNLVSGLTFNPDGTYSFKGPQDFNGTVTFTYKANDGAADSNTATVTLTVNPVEDNVAPTAGAGTASGAEDTTITGSVEATDPNGDPLTYSLVQGARASNGNPVSGLTFNSDGSYSFTGPSNFNGTITFSYRASDGSLDSNVATVTLTVTPVNDAPAAQAASSSGDEDTTITGTVTATDVEGSALTYSLVQVARDGNGNAVAGLTFNPDGTYTFQGPQDFNGTVTFTYRANDGAADSNEAPVTITIDPVDDNTAPVAANANASGDEDATIAGSVSAADGEGDALTYALVQGAHDADGNLVTGLAFNPDGTYSFRGPGNFNGTVTITYKANDGSLDSNVATVTLAVNPVNDEPSVPAITRFSGDEDIPISGSVSATDADGDPLTYILGTPARDQSGNPVTGLVFNSDGTFSFQGPQDYSGNVTFRYRAFDGSLPTPLSIVELTINPVNDSPTVSPIQASGDEDTLIEGSVTATDVDSVNFTYALVQGARDTSGNAVEGLTFNPDGTFSFQGPQDFNGEVTFTYKANDGTSDSNVATATLTINPMDDPNIIRDNQSIANQGLVGTAGEADVFVFDWTRAIMRPDSIIGFESGLDKIAIVKDQSQLPSQASFQNGFDLGGDPTIADATYFIKLAVLSTQIAVLDTDLVSSDFVFHRNDPYASVSPPLNSVSASVVSTTEGEARTIFFRRNVDFSQPLDIQFTLSGTVESEDVDISLGSTHTVRIEAGQESVGLTVDPIDDATVEGTELLRVDILESLAYELSRPSNLSGASAVLRIVDNDALPVANIVRNAASEPGQALEGVAGEVDYFVYGRGEPTGGSINGFESGVDKFVIIDSDPGFGQGLFEWTGEHTVVYLGFGGSGNGILANGSELHEGDVVIVPRESSIPTAIQSLSTGALPDPSQRISSMGNWDTLA